VAVLPTLVAGDLVESLEAVGFSVRHRVHPVLVLGVRHEILAELRLLLFPMLRRQLVTRVDLVTDLPAEVAGDDDLLLRLIVRFHWAWQFEPGMSFIA